MPHGLSHHLHNFMFVTHRQDLSLCHWEMYSFSRRGPGPVLLKPGDGLGINIGCHPLDCQY